jgi:hypothetical protein
MAKKNSPSSPREKRLPASALFTTPLGKRELAEIEKLGKMRDSEIDFSDAPELKPSPQVVYVGRFYRPGKTTN